MKDMLRFIPKDGINHNLHNFPEKILTLESENEALNAKILNPCDNVDIGNGVLLNKEFLSTIKATSGTANIFGRTLFKKLFESHEIIGTRLWVKDATRTRPRINHQLTREEGMHLLVRRVLKFTFDRYISLLN